MTKHEQLRQLMEKVQQLRHELKISAENEIIYSHDPGLGDDDIIYAVADGLGGARVVKFEGQWPDNVLQVYKEQTCATEREAMDLADKWSYQEDDSDDESPWYCQACNCTGIEEDFVPTNGKPGLHYCPECGSTNCFSGSSPEE